MRRSIVCILALSFLFLAPALAADKVPSRNEGPETAATRQLTRVSIDRELQPAAPRIVNRVVDLLDAEVTLASVDGPTVWESAAFDTAQYNRIGLRFSADMEDASVTCRVCWQYGRDDEFQSGVPVVTMVQSSSTAPFERPDGSRDLYVQWPFSVPSMDFTEVRGLRAHVRCALGTTLPDFGRIGDDPSLSGELDPVDYSATVTDVQVLLRRE